MGKKRHLIGLSFGRLTVVYEVEPHIYPTGRPRRQYLCKCKCGKEKIVRVNDLGVRVNSCGCLRAETTTILKYNHGMANSRLNSIWSNMKNRCYNPKCEFYYCYGGKGINVCESWKENFNSFMQWAFDNGYNDSLTIDRIDISKDYSPSNCKWSTQIEQANNRSSNIKIGICGEFKTLTQWSRELNLNPISVNGKFRRSENVYYSLGID